MEAPYEYPSVLESAKERIASRPLSTQYLYFTLNADELPKPIARVPKFSIILDIKLRVIDKFDDSAVFMKFISEDDLVAQLPVNSGLVENLWTNRTNSDLALKQLTRERLVYASVFPKPTIGNAEGLIEYINLEEYK